MNVAAQLYTVREFTQTPQGIAETLRKVSQIGYRTVHCSKMGPIDPYQLRDLLQENNLSCVVTHIDPERLLTEVDRVIEEHRIYHCDSVGMSIMPERYRGSYEGLMAMVRDFTPAVERILDSGLTFHYHNHDVEFIRYQKRSLLEHLLDAMPQANLLVCCYWVQVGGGDPIALLKRYQGRVRHVHLKDMACRAGVKQTGEGRIMTPVFEGNMNYAGIIDCCEQTGVENIIVEQDHCNGMDPFECLAISYRNIQEYLQKRNRP